MLHRPQECVLFGHCGFRYTFAAKTHCQSGIEFGRCCDYSSTDSLVICIAPKYEQSDLLNRLRHLHSTEQLRNVTLSQLKLLSESILSSRPSICIKRGLDMNKMLRLRIESDDIKLACISSLPAPAYENISPHKIAAVLVPFANDLLQVIHRDALTRNPFNPASLT